MAEDWQKEVQNLRMEIRGMYDALQAEDILLTREMREERLKEIRIKEKEAEDFQTSIFGPNGSFFVKQQELMKPVMEKIFDACRKVSAKNRLDFLFDKSGDIVMIFTNPRHDYTDFVLEELGLLDPKNPKN
jgi:outer membrane protein